MHYKWTLLVVEDEDKLLRTLSDFLALQGYEVLQASDGQKALEVFYNNMNQIDLVLLDIMLPQIGGNEVLREIRKKSQVPVIMLTANSSVEGQLYSFSKGADDYIVKPYTLSIIKAHVEAVLKRVGKNSQTLEAGRLRLDLPAQKVYRKGEYVETTRREYELLLFFMENQGRVLKREHILDAVWGYDYSGETRTVDTLVKQLRKKLTEECNYIRSVYGVGYIFEAGADEK
ncbi:MAG: response regulator transcription factor [Lachnospiraceae bacterium]|nr:response regulator transcription factor [Lachnospiraceae bacterium]MCI9547562.1 response regulator transcription factor [Lachnospiraceae bacterium]